MKWRVHSFLLLPPPLLPPGFLELFICVLWLRVTAGAALGVHWECSTKHLCCPNFSKPLAAARKHQYLCTSERQRERKKKYLPYIRKKLAALQWAWGEQGETWRFVLQWGKESWTWTGCLNTVTKLSGGHWERDFLSPIHFFREATHNTKLIKASILRKRNVPFGKFRNSWLVLSITFVLTSVELIQLSLFMKLSFLCYLIATNCCNYISELQIFCTDKNFDCLSATHKEKITSAKWGVPRLDNNA